MPPIFVNPQSEPESLAPNTPRQSESERVLNCRENRLRDAGYSIPQAFVLSRSGADLHVAIDLVRGGCEPWRALDILL